ncbi:hypothetical protein Y032_0599g477 [Ancylostoma ceylanicum]|uniref:Uncharacterized protein n=1 Tax=Ancylostoma ceylanicum TaxID=53326 RepID=A0A016WP00_9BILA|nr:hypothetical protein Y032_0599g477 [Ancylostoma ceylanicum]
MSGEFPVNSIARRKKKFKANQMFKDVKMLGNSSWILLSNYLSSESRATFHVFQGYPTDSEVSRTILHYFIEVLFTEFLQENTSSSVCSLPMGCVVREARNVALESFPFFGKLSMEEQYPDLQQ